MSFEAKCDCHVMLFYQIIKDNVMSVMAKCSEIINYYY